jgi:hypothetical protein
VDLMTRRNLIVLENPWEDQNGDIATYSMRPFVEGLCELYEHRLIYRTFTSGHELARLVEREAMDSKPGRYLLYLSSHGYGGRLVAGRYSDKAVNVAPIVSKLAAIATRVVRPTSGLAAGRPRARMRRSWAGSTRSTARMKGLYRELGHPTRSNSTPPSTRSSPARPRRAAPAAPPLSVLDRGPRDAGRQFSDDIELGDRGTNQLAGDR